MFRFVLLTLLLAPILLGQSRAEQETPAQHKSNETQTPPSASSANSQPSSPTQQNKTEQQSPKCPLPIWTDPFWSNWALVLVTLGAVWIAFGTLGDLKQQTEITKTSAETAKKAADAAWQNAQAVINSERPWVIIFAIKSGRAFTFKAGNMGRTPADIVTYFAVSTFVDRVENLPIPVHYGIGAVPELSFLVPGETLDDANSDLLTYDVESILTNDSQRAKEIFAGREVFVFYFRIDYKSTISNVNYETRMCFWYSPTSGLKVGGPQEYNKHT